MGGPIPWTAIAAYADRQGWVGEMLDDAVHLIRAMDAVILEREAERTKR